jgi:hypothetical protein
MPALSLLISPTTNGWGVYLSDGQELVRYRGPWSQLMASRYLRRYIRAATGSQRTRGQR